VEEFQKLSNPFDLAPPDDRKLVTQLFEQVLKKPGNNAEAVYRIKHKNGYHIWIESIMTNLTSDPNVHAVVLNYRDVTKRKELETQKDDFIGIASHELKTPVTSIKAYTQLLQRQFKQFGNEKATQNLAKMDAQLNKLNALISDLLDVTKIDSGKIVFNKDLFDFDKLIADTIDQMQLISEQHNITLKGTVKKDVFADRERIGLVLTNLLTNAVKYSPHGDNVTVHVSKDGKDVVVGVQDLGIGIPKKNLSKVFERFFRVKSPKGDTYPGLGLGLYISAEIIKRHEGKMWVDSEHNRGSTFYFSIPIIGKRETNKLKTEDVEEEMKHE
ncbi:MAG: ATP-binding protein, partial [Candidatus Levyibacteriota bacterium]